MISAARRPFDGDWKAHLQAERERLGVTPRDGFLRLKEAAAYVGVKPHRMRYLVVRGKVPATRQKMTGPVFGWKIPVSALNRLKPMIQDGSL